MLLPLIQAKLLRSEVREMFVRLRKVSGMWHTKDEYQNLYGQNVEMRWMEQEDRYSACILARFGGDADVLVALRAGMLARARSVKLKDSRRMAYVEALIREGFDNEVSIKMLEDSTWIGAEVKMIWKRHRRRRERPDELEVFPPPTMVPVMDDAFLADKYLTFRKNQVAVSSTTMVEKSTGGKPGSESGAEHHEEERDDVCDEIEDIIKEYDDMRNTMNNLGSYYQRTFVVMPKSLLQYRQANSRAILYMQVLQSNSFRSGIKSLEGDVASTTWSQFAGS